MVREPGEEAGLAGAVPADGAAIARDEHRGHDLAALVDAFRCDISAGSRRPPGPLSTVMRPFCRGTFAPAAVRPDLTGAGGDRPSST
jgi:hypothetical protein